jgi:hypothetical protein
MSLNSSSSCCVSFRSLRYEYSYFSGAKGAAIGAANFLTDRGLFRGQLRAFFALLRDLAEDADDARRES